VIIAYDFLQKEVTLSNFSAASDLNNTSQITNELKEILPFLNTTAQCPIQKFNSHTTMYIG
jgi:hypothetical protein